MLIEKAEIRRLVPHHGEMCLIDSVAAWDERSIACVSSTHRRTSNPLRRGERLAAVHAFEYGAQAAAVHGGLLARRQGMRPPFAYLGAIRAGVLHAARLDLIAGDLALSAELLMGDPRSAVYKCRVAGEGRILAEARLTLVFVERAAG